jgi:TRAP-type mannitol/chloroaromatic compound transport system substrate-binding protein
MDAWINHGVAGAVGRTGLGEFGLKSLLCGNTGVQMGGWFNKEINLPTTSRV